MIKNKRFEERRKKISKDVDIFVNQSFDIVDRIHKILEKQGKEQKDLAQLLGKRESEISKWMTGTHNFTLNTLAKIQAVLGESVIEVTDENQKKNPYITFISFKESVLDESTKSPTPFSIKMYDQYFSHILNDVNEIGTLNKIVDSNINKSYELPFYVFSLMKEKLFENTWEIDNPKDKHIWGKSNKTSEVSTKMKLAVVNKEFQHTGS